MNIDASREKLAGVRQVRSPNCDARPDCEDISLIVIHGISLPPGEYGGPWIDALFTNQLDPAAHPYFADMAGLRVSSHVLIRRDGEVVQYVPFTERAWHAGDSCYGERGACNDYSIGIEMEGQDGEPYVPIQYEQLAVIIAELVKTFPGLSRERIVGHCDIAPGRKTDPGPAFDWALLTEKLGKA